MPQFDTFIFSSSLVYFVSCFFLLLSYNYMRLLPRVGSLLKLRSKIVRKSADHSVTVISLKNTGLSFTSLLINNIKN